MCKLFTCQSATSLPPCHKFQPGTVPCASFYLSICQHPSSCHKSRSSSIPISQAPLTDRNVYICAEVRRQYAGRCPSSARAALDFGVYINYNARTAGLSGYQLYHRLLTSAARRKKTLRTSGGSFIQQTDHLSHYLLIIVKIKELKLEVVIIADEVLCLTSWSFFSSGLICLRS